MYSQAAVTTATTAPTTMPAIAPLEIPDEPAGATGMKLGPGLRLAGAALGA